MKKISLPSMEFMHPFFDKIAKLSKLQRILICVLVLVLIIGPVVYFIYVPKYQEINRLTEQYQSLVAELDKYKRKAREIHKYRAEVKKMEAEFQVAKQALPESEEIPTLLTNISNSGQDAGLEFILFRPEKEIESGFYAKIPVSIKVTGTYHETLSFFERVSKLSRIVNIKDIRISEAKRKKSRRKVHTGPQKDLLDITCTAVTYKFIEKSAKAK